MISCTVKNNTRLGHMQYASKTCSTRKFDAFFRSIRLRILVQFDWH